MLGAMHLAGDAFDALEKNTKKLGETFEANEVDRQTLRIAALLHDVGHAPFSHSLENLLSDKHEIYGNVLIDNYFASILDDANIDRKLVKNLIVGDPYPEKSYLSRIINGQLDVDRLDYLLRDSHYTGVWYGEFDLDRIIEQLCVVDKKFVVMQGGYESVEQMIVARHHMYQGVYFHKTKRSFELMLWQCAEILKEKGLLSYPSTEELKEKEGQERYAMYDDNWFLNRLYDERNPQDVKIIAKMIRERKPYIETYSPLTNRKKTERIKSQPDESVEGLEPIQTHLLKKLADLGIEKYEFLTDDLSRAPYNLMPNYSISDEAEPEGNTIQIFYKNNHLIEPIEKRSRLVYQLGGNRPFMIRGFVIPAKYGIVRKFLIENYDYHLPERSD
ncbi:HD domain-containing protein [Candidatus Nitrosotenuis chungbukensis]|uniref:HD domain-containing protein n=1 Tax=Candidatus Nitrosotenuis chungbukensis TaxID=1353246 RepID=UPI00069366C6|nr:HD domain-containing protein [Candidatus Nitrosotenuis chungbukensis]